jgi:hypothetical protein
LVRVLARARVLELEPGLARVLELGLVLVLELVLGLARELALARELEPGLVRVLELAAEEEELGVEAVDCSALVGAILNIHPHSMVKKVALVFKLRWMKAAMWMGQKLQEKEAAANSMKLR